jgi:hypothetical protein
VDESLLVATGVVVAEGALEGGVAYALAVLGLARVVALDVFALPDFTGLDGNTDESAAVFVDAVGTRYWCIRGGQGCR